jgi:drug/metabolite transporter (DMT)-like permease
VKPLSRILGVVSLLLAIAAAGVPAIGALLLLQADSSTIVDRAPLLGLAAAGVGVVLAVVGYVVGRRSGTTALPIIGGLSSVFVGVGFALAPLFV